MMRQTEAKTLKCFHKIYTFPTSVCNSLQCKISVAEIPRDDNIDGRVSRTENFVRRVTVETGGNLTQRRFLHVE
jgi:hypothetical protein